MCDSFYLAIILRALPLLLLLLRLMFYLCKTSVTTFAHVIHTIWLQFLPPICGGTQNHWMYDRVPYPFLSSAKRVKSGIGVWLCKTRYHWCCSFCVNFHSDCVGICHHLGSYRRALEICLGLTIKRWNKSWRHVYIADHLKKENALPVGKRPKPGKRSIISVYRANGKRQEESYLNVVMVSV